MLALLVHNDGTGDTDIANYDVRVLVNQNTLAQGRVEGHKRANGWRVLLRAALEQAKDLTLVEDD